MKINTEGVIFQFINTLCGFVALNVIFLLTCLPVVTAGAAITALYKVTLQEAGEENGYLIRTYLLEMRNNLKRPTLAFLLLFLSGSILLFNMVFWASYGGMAGAAFLFVVTLAMMLLLITALYTFPLLARFPQSLSQTVRSAYPLAMKHRKTTFFLLIIHGVFFTLCLLFPKVRLFMALIGFSFLALCSSIPLVKIFRQYERDNRNDLP